MASHRVGEIASAEIAAEEAAAEKAQKEADDAAAAKKANQPPPPPPEPTPPPPEDDDDTPYAPPEVPSLGEVEKFLREQAQLPAAAAEGYAQMMLVHELDNQAKWALLDHDMLIALGFMDEHVDQMLAACAQMRENAMGGGDAGGGGFEDDGGFLTGDMSHISAHGACSCRPSMPRPTFVEMSWTDRLRALGAGSELIKITTRRDQAEGPAKVKHVRLGKKGRSMRSISSARLTKEGLDPSGIKMVTIGDVASRSSARTTRPCRCARRRRGTTSRCGRPTASARTTSASRRRTR